MHQSLEAFVRENVHEFQTPFIPCQINNEVRWDGLDGIFLGKGVSEVFGEAGAGKSQFVLFLLYQFLLNNQTKSALYLSTDNYFKANRFFDFCHSQPELGDRLFIQQIYDADSLLQYLNYFVSQLIEQEGIAFIVLDSIAGPLRVCDTSEQKAYIAEIVKCIRTLIHTYGIQIIITNQATASLGTSNLASRELSSPKWIALLRNCSPALGLFWSNCIDTRVYIERRVESPSPSRSLFLIRSPTHKPFSCTMEICADTIKFTV